jgi:cysteine synthase
MKHHSILSTIGNTPTVRINRLFRPDCEVWLKLERANPGGSIKDRIALSMVNAAEASGLLTPDTTIIEPTSGNTGIGLALVCAVKGYKLILVMPESMSIERRRIMLAYGAQLELTPRELGVKGAIARAEVLAQVHTPAWIPMQFQNAANPAIHRETTCQEILSDFPEGLDLVVTGVGTGGHISACAEVLKPRWSSLRVIAVEPTKSPVLSGGQHSPHRLQGIGAGFIPDVLRTDLLDGIALVSEEDAFLYAQRAAKEEGIFIGASSGATLAAIAAEIEKSPIPRRILGFCYDTGERYLSIEGLFPN